MAAISQQQRKVLYRFETPCSGTLKGMFDVVAPLTVHAPVHISKTGIKFGTLGHSHGVFCQLTKFASMQYNSTKPFEIIGIDFQIMKDVTSSFGASDTVALMAYADEPNKFIVEVSCDGRRRITTLSTLHIQDAEIMELPPHTYNSCVNMDAQSLHAVFKAHSALGQPAYTQFLSSRGDMSDLLFIVTTGDYGTTETFIELAHRPVNDDSLPCVAVLDCNADKQSQFNHAAVTALSKAHVISPTVRIYLSSEAAHPLVLQ